MLRGSDFDASLIVSMRNWKNLETSNVEGAIMARFRDKSPHQKVDCIKDCGRQSTLEAVNGTAEVRCCSNEECKAFAARLADDIGSIRSRTGERFEEHGGERFTCSGD